ncbi:hypothetical protein KKG45_14470 [bacterium]|nr:hypothetical protein [bacterium]MBU1676225.1 hypothetical protein [bacterium]
MRAEHYNYTFHSGTDMSQVEDTLVLATMAAEGLHGRCSIQLDASFKCDATALTAEVDVSTDVGRTIARIFTAILSSTIGETMFRVERDVGVGCA